MILWIIIGIIAVIVDAFTGAFLFSWFAIGAVAALIGESLGLSLLWQILIFLVVSSVLVITCYPIIKKKIKVDKKTLNTMEENYIGKIYTADEDILKEGRIKISGIYWAGINEGEEIKKGEEFVVTGIVGSKLKIKKK